MIGKRAVAGLFWLLVSVPLCVWADSLCNGNALAGEKLRPLTFVAAASTLRAASETYQMLAFLEEGRDRLAQARTSGESAIKHLTTSIDLLEKDATALPDQEFARMTVKLQRMDFVATAQKLGIAPVGLWEQVATASKSGGRGWLGACLQSKQVLRTQTQGFVTQLRDPPKPSEIWRLMAVWSQELARQRYLTTALYE